MYTVWPHLLVVAVYLGASALHKELPAIDVGIQHLLSCPLKILVRKDASTDGESCLAIHLELMIFWPAAKWASCA